MKIAVLIQIVFKFYMCIFSVNMTKSRYISSGWRYAQLVLQVPDMPFGPGVSRSPCSPLKRNTIIDFFKL